MGQPTAELGQVIAGRYRVTSLLGVGGMGSVFRAEHTGIGRPVAIKLLHRDLADDPTFAKRFEREAFVTGRSAHPNCVNVSDFGRLEDGTLYLVMELLDGEPLSEVLEAETRIEWSRALRIVRHVLRGLSHAHAADIVHRDVKPENVIIVRSESDPDFSKILDFGIAKMIGETAEVDDNQLTQFGTTVGTPNYVAPEQALGQPVDGRSDLYSLSIMLYEMITGSPPFYSDDTLKVLSMHVAADVPKFSDREPDLDVPDEVEALVRKGLEKSNKKRHASATAYIAAIDAIIGPAPVRAQTPLPVDSVAPPKSANAAVPLPQSADAAVPPQTQSADAAVPLPQSAGAAALPHSAQASLPVIPTAPTALALTPPPSNVVHPISLSGMPIASARWSRSRLYIMGGVALLAITAIAMATGGGSDGAGSKTPSNSLIQAPTAANSIALFGKPEPGRLATDAKGLMAKGDPQGTIALLEKNRDDIANDPFSQLQLGHAHFALGEDTEGIEAYKQAVTLYPDLRDDDKLRTNAGMAADSKDPDAQIDGLEFQSLFLKEDSAKTRLAKIATSHKKLAVRKRAREIATSLGIIDRVDVVASLGLDLLQEKDCEIKKSLIARLQGLDDKRAIKFIKKARNKRKSSGFLGLRSRRVNKCLTAEADAAIKHLKSLPD